MLMHQLLIDGAALEPDKVAFRWADRNKTLTYVQAVEATRRPTSCRGSRRRSRHHLCA